MTSRYKNCENLKHNIIYYSAHRLLINPFRFTREVYSSSQTENVNKNENEASYDDHVDGFTYKNENSIGICSAVRIEYLN